MGDIFLEQIVKKQDGIKDKLRKAIILFVGLLLIVGSIILLFVTGFYNAAPLGILVLAGAIYYTWYIISGLNLEFEYIYTNGEIDFDKISAKRKRKRVKTIKIINFLDFGEVNSKTIKEKKFDKVYDLSSYIDNPGTYYCTYKDAENRLCAILFSPNENLLAEIEKIYNRHKRVKYD